MIFVFGKWVLQHYVSIFVSYCTLASISIAALCLFAANPLKLCALVIKVMRKITQTKIEIIKSLGFQRDQIKLTHFQHVQV